MKNIYIILVLLLSIHSTTNAQTTFSQVSNTCTGTFEMIDQDIYEPTGAGEDIYTLVGDPPYFTVNNNNDYGLEIEISSATAIELDITVAATATSDGDSLYILDGNSTSNDTLYKIGDGIKTIYSTTNVIYLYFYDGPGASAGSAMNFKVDWKGHFNADGLANDISCNGAADGKAQVFPDGGTEPYKYLWDTGNAADTLRKITGLSITDDYTVTITDSNNCIFDTTFHIIEPGIISTNVLDSSNVLCKGDNSGWIDLNITGGTTPFTYLWSDGQTTKKADSLLLGFYDCTITDANNCKNSIKNIYLSQPLDIVSYDTINIKDTLCSGTNAGGIKIAGIGGTSGLDGTEDYIYKWNTGAKIDTIGNLYSGNYFLTVTDSVGCTYLDTITIDTYTPISISESITNVTTYSGSDGEIDITVTNHFGTPTYNWNVLDLVTNTEDQDSLMSGNYSVTVTDEHSCTATESFFVNQPGSTSGGEIYVNYTGNETDTVCEGLYPSIFQSQVQAFDSTAGSGVNYDWQYSTDLETWISTGITSATICDWNFAIDENTYIRRKATQTPQVAYSNLVLLKFIPKYSKSIKNLSSDYCEDADTAVIIGNPNLAISTFTPAVYLTNISGYQATFSPSAAGVGSVNVEYTYEDSYGCKDTATQSVNIWPVPDVTVNSIPDYNGVNISCKDSTDGSIEISGNNGTPNYTYKWGANAGGSTSNLVSDLSAGIYSCTVTDSKGCKVVWNTELTEPASAFTAIFKDSSDFNGWGVNCRDSVSGWIEVDGIGGTGTTGDFVFNWYDASPAQTTAKASDLEAGIYNCEVTDQNSCIDTIFNLTLSQPMRITGNLADSSNHNDNGYKVSCFGLSDGSLKLGINGGTKPYSYAWDDGQTGIEALSLPQGNYNVTVTDINGCDTVMGPYNVNQPDEIWVNGSVTDASYYGNDDGEIDITVSNPVVSIQTYSWIGAGVNASADDQTGLVSGYYSVTVTDENNCTDDSTFFVDEPSDLVGGTIEVNSSTTENVCDGDKPSQFTNSATALGGASAINYEWESSVNQITWNTIVGSLGNSYTWDSIIQQDFYIRRKAMNTAGDSAYSNILFLDYIAPQAVSITNIEDAYCYSDETVTLIGSPTGNGGTFSTTGPDKSIPDPSIISLANGLAEFNPYKLDTTSTHTFTISYEYTENGCTNTVDSTILIRTDSVPWFSIIDKLAVGEESKITDHRPKGGIFTGIGVTSTGIFNATDLIPGVKYGINYEKTDIFGCTGKYSDTVTVIEGAGKFFIDPGFNNELKNIHCFDTDSFPIYADTYRGNPENGHFLDLVYTNATDSTIGHLNPADYSGSANNKYLIRYAYEGTEGATSYNDTIRQEISVYDISDKATILDLNPQYCKNSPATQIVTIHAVESNEGTGSFNSLTGFTDNGDKTATMDVNAMDNTNGTPDTVSYTYHHNLSECEYTQNKPLDIFNQPTVNFSIKDTFNVEEPAKLFDNYSPEGGNFSGTGVVEEDTTFNPRGLSGNYTITYSYTDTNGCKNSAAENVYVDQAKGNFVGLDNLYCTYASTDTIVYKPNGNSHIPIDYKLITSSDTVIMSTGIDTIVIVPDTLDGGSYTIDYTYLNIDGETSFTLSKKITIEDPGTPSINVSKTDFCNYDLPDTVRGEINGEIISSGLFYGQGLTGHNINDGKCIFTPTAIGSGDWEIVYEYNSENCQVYDTSTFTIHDRPTLDFTLEAVYNVNGNNDTIISAPSGGTFSPSDYFVKDNIFDPSIAGVGTCQ